MKFWGETERAFKRRMRRAFRKLLDGDGPIKGDEMALGSGYLPDEAYEKFNHAWRLLDEAREICRPWWRNA